MRTSLAGSHGQRSLSSARARYDNNSDAAHTFYVAILLPVPTVVDRTW